MCPFDIQEYVCMQKERCENEQQTIIFKEVCECKGCREETRFCVPPSLVYLSTGNERVVRFPACLPFRGDDDDANLCTTSLDDLFLPLPLFAVSLFSIQ